MDNDCSCSQPVPGYLDQWAAGLVHDCPRVGGQRPAEEGGAQVHRHRGEPAHAEREGDNQGVGILWRRLLENIIFYS